MLALTSFLKDFRLKKENAAGNQTHTCFGVLDPNAPKGRGTKILGIPADKEKTFFQLYLQQFEGNANNHSETMSFSEKIGSVFPLFIDVDFDVQWFLTGKLAKENLGLYIEEILRTCISIVGETFGDDLDTCYVSKRTSYKLHIHFPNVFVTKDTAERIVNSIKVHMNEKYSGLLVPIGKTTSEDYLWNRALDTSVYNTGLRMLKSHKGNLTNHDEIIIHKQVFDDDNNSNAYSYSYDHVEKVLIDEEDGDLVVDKVPIDLDLVQKLSIRRIEDVTEIASDSLLQKPSLGKYVKPKVTRAKSSSLDDTVVLPDGTRITTECENDLDRSKSMELPSGVQETLFEELRKRTKDTLGLDIDFTSVKRLSRSSDVLSVTPTITPCPFADRTHSRCTSSSPRPSLYFIVSPVEMSVRCWSAGCKGAQQNLGETPEDLRSSLFNMSSLETIMYKTLYNQSTEYISQFIFQLLKKNHAVVPENNNMTKFVWYHFSSKKHRWVKEKRILLHIMNDNGVVQNTMQRYVDLLIKKRRTKAEEEEGVCAGSDGEDDSGEGKKSGGGKSLAEQAIETMRSKWNLLRGLLQNGNFVQASILGLVGLKLHLDIEDTHGKPFVDLIDNYPHLLGFTNGVFDFKERCFRAGRHDDFISLTTKLEYTPYDKHSSHVRAGLEEAIRKLLPVKEEYDYMLKEIASCLDGTSRSQRFFILTGHGSNGKSTLVKLINYALGDYAGESDVSLFTKPRPPSSSPTEDVFCLRGKRFVVCHEPNERDQLYLGTVKWITGGDRICARPLYGHQQNFYLQCTVFMLCNAIPQIRAGQDDYGAWRRLKPREFVCRFVDTPDPEKEHEYAVDPNMNDYLIEWKEAFIALLIKYNLSANEYDEPASFKNFERQLQESANHYAKFCKDIVRFDNVETPVPVEEVYRTFNIWTKHQNIDKRVSGFEFARQMSRVLGEEHGKMVEDENGKKCWKIRIDNLVMY